MINKTPEFYSEQITDPLLTGDLFRFQSLLLYFLDIDTESIRNHPEEYTHLPYLLEFCKTLPPRLLSNNLPSTRITREIQQQTLNLIEQTLASFFTPQPTIPNHTPQTPPKEKLPIINWQNKLKEFKLYQRIVMVLLIHQKQDQLYIFDENLVANTKSHFQEIQDTFQLPQEKNDIYQVTIKIIQELIEEISNQLQLDPLSNQDIISIQTFLSKANQKIHDHNDSQPYLPTYQSNFQLPPHINQTLNIIGLLSQNTPTSYLQQIKQLIQTITEQADLRLQENQKHDFSRQKTPVSPEKIKQTLSEFSQILFDE